MISLGDRAPEFQLPDADMKGFKSSDLAGKHYVMYFYPKDDTPGCTLEAQEFSDLVDEFADAEAVVVGVSRDTCVSHAAFRDKYGLTVNLIADVNKSTRSTVCANHATSPRFLGEMWSIKEPLPPPMIVNR